MHIGNGVERTSKIVAERSRQFTSQNPSVPPAVEALLQEVLCHSQNLVNDEVSVSLIRDGLLTETLLFVKKIEDLTRCLQENGIPKFRIPISFGDGEMPWSGIRYGEFFEYFELEETEVEADMGLTTSAFSHQYKSRRFPGISLTYQEFYEHEDDTDGGGYFVVFSQA